MKLIIQIPCFNEENTLTAVLKDLPREIPGIDVIETLVIDDGSTDRTVKVARDNHVDHVLELGTNRGLAFAFSAGLKYALEKDADIVVNTDGDHQYHGGDIARLVQPVVEKLADIVVGCRPIRDHREFGVTKKAFQLLGSWTLRKLSRTQVRDATSGFRAFSREACLRLFIYSSFSYTLETLIQAGTSNLRVGSVDVGVNPKTRESRLFRHMFEHIFRSGSTMINMFLYYRPGRFFFWIGTFFNTIALLLGLRFLYLIFIVEHPDVTRTYIPSLILLAILAFWGIVSYFIGILGELLKSNRKLSEEIMANQRRILYGKE